MSQTAKVLMQGLYFSSRHNSKDVSSSDLLNTDSTGEIISSSKSKESLISRNEKKRKRKHDANTLPQKVDEDDTITSEAKVDHPIHNKIDKTGSKIKITGDRPLKPIQAFTSLNLNTQLNSNMMKKGYTDPSDIQAASYPPLISGRDLIAISPTGSGKTLAYLLPIIQAISSLNVDHSIKALIIAPTTELMGQVYEVCKILIANIEGLGVRAFNSRFKPKQELNANLIMIGPPLRLLNAIKKKSIDLSSIKYLVLDEVDKLFEHGYVKQTDEVLAAIPPSACKAVFSATMSSGVETLVKSVMRDPLRVIIGTKDAVAQNIEQKLLYVGTEHGKLLAIRQMVQRGEIVPPVFIFVQSIERARALYNQLLYDGINSEVFHGHKSASERDGLMQKFKSGELWVLISTELLARGIDLDDINLIINFDCPTNPQSYVHRVGRTGRFNKKGKALTLFTDEDFKHLRSVVNVMRISGCDIPEWMIKSLPKVDQKAKKRLKYSQAERSRVGSRRSTVRKGKKKKSDKTNKEKGEEDDEDENEHDGFDDDDESIDDDLA